MGRRSRIMLVITELGIGGAENLVVGLAHRFAQAGHEVLIVSLMNKNHFNIEADNINVVSLNLKKNIFSLAITIARLRRAIYTFRPDVVNSHLFHANIICRFLRLFCRMPRLVSSAHSTNDGSNLRMLLYRLTDKLASISTNVSNAAVTQFEERKAVPQGRMVCIHNAIDVDFFSYQPLARESILNYLSLPLESRIILSVGRMHPAKDFPNLLHAFKFVYSRFPNAVLLLIGDGPLLADLKALSMRLEIEQAVFFLGQKSDIPFWMSSADVFVLSSEWEGFGLVVAEAMSCGRLVVSTDCGGTSEVIGDAGWLVPSRSPKLLFQGISECMLITENERSRVSVAARQRVERKFSLDQAMQKWLKLYGLL